ncbi:MAG: endonuclease, partial [Lutibacter sp.]|nr:endonuclease [Lutibacter sp.]
MKKLTLTASFLFLLNVILAFMLLLSYLSYFIAPDRFALIPFVSLSVPLLILVNIFFAIYWLVKLQKKCLLSVVVLLIGYPYLSKLYAVHEKKVLLTDDLTVMSYNIRMFNHYQWIKTDNIDLKILDFIEEKKPDILCLQEYFNAEDRPINYPYQYVKTKSNTNHFGHAIFSK